MAPGDDPPTAGGFDATTYGRSFADVYDDWYPAEADTEAAVAALCTLGAPGSRVLELGVGTGRLALPLAAAGRRVVGLDASAEMLARLAAKDPGGTVTAVEADVADPAAWPDGPFQVVLAACNLLVNLADPAAQHRVVATAADRLAPDGVLVVETPVPAPLTGRERRLEVREVRSDAVVLIASDADAATGQVLGQHVELRDGEPVRLRPWRIRLVPVDEVDRWAHEAGLVTRHRWADWSGTAPGPDAERLISVYARAT